MSSPTTSDVRTIPALLLAGVIALALAVAFVVSLPGGATAEESSTAHGQHDRAQRHGDAAPHMRGEHLGEHAAALGVDETALAEVMENLRADRTTLRGEERRAAMSDALLELGVDPAVLAEHRQSAEHRRSGEHGPRDGMPRGSGPHGQR